MISRKASWAGSLWGDHLQDAVAVEIELVGQLSFRDIAAAEYDSGNNGVSQQIGGGAFQMDEFVAGALHGQFKGRVRAGV